MFRFIDGELNSPPPYPEHYFPDEAIGIAESFICACRTAIENNDETLKFPERELEQQVLNTWGDTGKAMVNNWLGLVYQLTSHDRRRQFMPGVDPDDPLQLGPR